ncbi:MAG: hypothetical protein Q8K82_13165 [Gemmatimonadaceae bacterium]|nr:hypothetical protein [Gemmatimonadaceae bacterium]
MSGQTRSFERFEWQWRRAPGGPGDMWVIEAACENGERFIVGHHGMMPIRFSRGREDLLFGKTENTFVHPGHRDKLLYPRFESRFASVYESRFDALFSTTGPSAAIRQRAAQGYDFPAVWQRHIVSTHSLSVAALGLRRLASRLPRRVVPWLGGGMRLVGRARANRRSRDSWTALDNEAARRSNFFPGFWDSARVHYGVTPRRDVADLTWRFWGGTNPSRTTIVVEQGSASPGYIVLRRHDDVVPWASIDDVATEHPDAASFRQVLNAARDWAAESSLHWLDVTVTDDAASSTGLGDALHDIEMATARRWQQRAAGALPRMPRKITHRGATLGLGLGEWFITGIVFEL